MAWDSPLQALLVRGSICGYALLDGNTGTCIASFGELNASVASDRVVLPLAQQLQKLLFTGERCLEALKACRCWPHPGGGTPPPAACQPDGSE